jgi:hypothetical protein
MPIFRYEYANIPLLHRFNARELLEGREFVSFDLGLSKEKVEFRGEKVIIRGIEVERNKLEAVARDKRDNIFLLLSNGEIQKTLFFNGKVYKLRLVGPCTAPTLEINGIHMHKIKEVTPWQDAEKKVKILDVKEKSVLDICTGLGYTAIHAKKLGAASILTIENDENVLRIAEFNPWSKELETIKVLLGDALKEVRKLSTESFDRVLHDPPREALARELYSRKFYSELFRVLRKNGKLFHYVGKPHMKKGRIFWKEVARRLEEVGFKNIRWVESVEGLICSK